MLKQLKIKNIALIDNLDIEFDDGLNVITGETGSGKSIIIDSINFLLGARADKSLIRYGEEKAKVEGVFGVDVQSPNIKNCFELLDIDAEDNIIITRTMSMQGKNEIKVNGETVSLNTLKKIAENLIDIYSQNQQLSILKPSFQLEMLDIYSEDIIGYIEKYKSLKNDLKQINLKIEDLGGDDEQRVREIDLLNYQINELLQANISEDEESQLLEKKRKLQNIEKINQYASLVANSIDKATTELFSANTNLTHCLSFDDGLKDLSIRVENLCMELADINETARDYVDSLSYDDRDIDEIEDRISLYNTLKRKYGSTTEKILDYYKNITNRVEMLQNCDKELNKLNGEKTILLTNVFEVAHIITEKRKLVASALKVQIMENLTKLGMKDAVVDFAFNDYLDEEKSLLTNGCDSVEIMFCANKGEELKPLSDVASGGEMSRFILAVKSITAKNEQNIAMIFDEIDTGISGLMAQAVAEQIARISLSHQVFVITHTVQLASMGDYNYLVEKREVESRTISNIRRLNEQEKVQEIARFLTTGNITDSNLETAKEIIQSQKQIKNKLIK